MKTRTYKTLTGKTFTELIPETEIEARLLEIDLAKGRKLEVRHSLGDTDKTDDKEET